MALHQDYPGLSALADPTIDPPPLNERGKVDLVAPAANGLTLLLEADHIVYDPQRGPLVVAKGEKVKFFRGRLEVDLETFWKIARTPAWTGETEPKQVWLADERPLMPGADGSVRVVDGAVNSATGRRPAPPLQNWEKITYAQLRKALDQGMIPSPLDALIYERTHGRNREGVLQLLLAAASGADLPSAKSLQAADRRAEKARAAEMGDPEPEEPPEPLAAQAPVETDDDIRAAIEAAAAEGGDLESILGDVAEDAEEPIPDDGTVM